MPLINTADLLPTTKLSDPDNLQVYCGIDNCVTREVFDEIKRSHNEIPQVYEFAKALQAPYLEIMLRGFAIDQLARNQAAEVLRRRMTKLRLILNQLALAVWDKPLNPRSPIMLQQFFYGALKLPEVWLSQKGQRKLSTNREALEKLESYLYARPFVSLILSYRDLAKQLEIFETQIDADGRYRTSYNIAGTETGRPSSSENAFGTGGNAQNISPLLRYVFVADQGWKLGQIDLEQVEARDVGFICGCLFDDWSFLNSCESGDLHSNNAKLIWPELSWTGDKTKDRVIAEQQFYRDFSYRDMAKRGSHLSNYMGTAWTAARSLKVPLAIMEEFQARYCKGRLKSLSKGQIAIEPAFPTIEKWWQWTAEQVHTTGELTTLFGRRRHFFGRPGDDATLREAIAFQPQGSTADRTNLGLWRIWKHMGHPSRGKAQVQVLGQGFDSVIFQYRESADENEIMQEALKLMEVEIQAPNGRKFVVPGEAKCGWNWGAASKTNPQGLVKWNSAKPDLRKRISGLQRIMA